jgi:hypothetical protein
MSKNIQHADEVLEALLRDEPIDPLLERLNPQEMDLYLQGLDELRATGQVLGWQRDYVEEPPSAEAFIESDYYLGATMQHREDNEGLFPYWRETFVRDFDLHSLLHNVVITGSLGAGKTWFGVLVLLYRLCVATFLRKPYFFFGLSRGSRIIYNILSVTRQQVTETAFGDAMNFMSASPFFIEKCGYDVNQLYTNGRIPIRRRLPDGSNCDIYLTAGSRGQHVLGRNIVGVLLDEGNFRLEANPDLKAYALYDSVRTRLTNRFQKVSGFLPAISAISSSAADESSFTERVIAEINQVNEPLANLPDFETRQKVYRQSIYRVKRHTLRLADRWFRVAYGIKNIDPILLRGWYTEAEQPIGPPEEHEAPPPGARIEFVPEDYYEAFRRNPKLQLQSLSGISAGGSFRLFSSLADVEWCIGEGERQGLANPCQTLLVPVSSEDNRHIWQYLDHDKFVTRSASRYQPLRHPYARRYVHLDLATRTMAGLSVCHLVGHQKIENLIREGSLFDEYRVVVEYDFILTLIAGQVKSINFDKIQQFIIWLRDFCGFSFGKITADQFQSEAVLQMLESAGYEVDKLSVDRDKTVYNAWRGGFEERRIWLFRQGMLMKEAEQLMEGAKQVDHPPNGSKDTTDSAAGAYFNAITSGERTGYMANPEPGIDTAQSATQPDRPPIEMPLPVSTGKKRVRFKV